MEVKNEGGLDQIEVQWLDNAFLGTGTVVPMNSSEK